MGLGLGLGLGLGVRIRVRVRVFWGVWVEVFRVRAFELKALRVFPEPQPQP